MAKEIRINAELSLSKGTLTVAKSSTTQVTMAGIVYAAGAVSVGTVAQELDLNGVIDLGYAYMRNTDPTNYIVIGDALDEYGMVVPFQKLKAGEFALLRYDPSVVLHVQADTADCVLDYIILAD